MKMKKYFLSIVALLSVFSCNQMVNEIKITDVVVNGNYLGNGAEWDPYCEAELWGAPMTEEMWIKIFERTDFMRMSIVRCMINSPLRYYNKETGRYDKERNSESLKRMLAYCQSNNITVMFGEFNPPRPELKLDEKWVKMAVNYLDYLVNECGFTCIKYYIPTNEPDGNWSVYDGNFEDYVKLIVMFREEMSKYPALARIKFAAPDAVLDYKNPKYDLTTSGRVAEFAGRADSLAGIYEIHAYPGFHQVRSGIFKDMLKEVLSNVPDGKRLILGEAGYKTWRPEDSLRDRIHKERLNKTSLVKNKEGADCSMSVYEYEYGLDIALLGMEVMNNGGAGVCPWMLDDVHSAGDRGDKNNVKIWGMWNIFGGKVWGLPEEENIRPWYYAWSLMCRYFPAGSDILSVTLPAVDGLHSVAAVSDGKLTVAVLNISAKKQQVMLSLPYALKNAKMYRYEKGNDNLFANMPPKPDKEGIRAENSVRMELGPDSMIMITDLD